MDFDDVAGMVLVVFLAALFTFALIRGSLLMSDVRPFKRVVEQCKERGYIQDTNTRILCQVEVK
jgi:hypothetical protein